MAKKLSKAQRDILEYIGQGGKVYRNLWTREWLGVRQDTMRILSESGFIRQSVQGSVYHPEQIWATLTPAGRAALAQA